VVSKVSYLCRTIRPDLFLPAARRVDVLLEGAFSTIYSVNRDVFTAGATAEQRLAAARVHLPTSLAGCGLRSAVTTSDAGYVAAWRAVAPAIAAASSDAARDALETLHTQPPAAPALRELVAAIGRVSAALQAADASLLALDTFTEPPAAGVQRRVTHAVETQAHTAAVAAARPSPTTRAFLHSWGWEDQVAAATDAMDVGNGHSVGISAHYRGEVAPPGRSGSVQPRFLEVLPLLLAHPGALAVAGAPADDGRG
jgi:hypothetical protein